MLTTTEYQISQEQLERAQQAVPDSATVRTPLNSPAGDFFYDYWQVNKEYQGTVWEEILSTLPDHGEARLIKLAEGTCYTIHADIDDRWHLNITGENSYLVDLHSKVMYPTMNYHRWFSMDAGILHSAVNFGNKDRYQLVVRKLLNRNVLTNPVRISIHDIKERRYLLDQLISPWLNFANKNSLITDFKIVDNAASFKIEEKELPTLKLLLDGNFNYDQDL
jgi:hypothetical protein